MPKKSNFIAVSEAPDGSFFDLFGAAVNRRISKENLFAQILGQAQTLPKYIVANLPPASAGSVAYASDGRKNGESAGLGTGVQVFHDAQNWVAVDTGQVVQS